MSERVGGGAVVAMQSGCLFWYKPDGMGKEGRFEMGSCELRTNKWDIVDGKTFAVVQWILG